MFEFYWPWLALLLPLPLLARLLWPRFVDPSQSQPIEGHRTTLLHPSIKRLQESFSGRRQGINLNGRLRPLLLTLLWCTLTLALMRPQWLQPHSEMRSEGYDLMLAVDSSRSMTALDFSRKDQPVSRMAVVKGVMTQFIQNRGGDRVGLIIFGNQAFVQSPLTFDLNAVAGILDTVSPGMAGDATAMGDAIGLSVKKLRKRPEGSRVLLLVTDGENTAGLIPPLEAAQLAAREGVRIYTIGVGSNKSSVMIRGTDGRYREEAEIGMDEKTLKKIAEQTGGDYFRATNTDALEKIYQHINTLEKSEAETRTILIPTPLYRWPLAGALLTLLLLGLFPEGRMRLPKAINNPRNRS
ncbi:MAG: VWA domain-containing protein [Candidatus Sedimenticola sp. (ex Thyasira tokunagai)]